MRIDNPNINNGSFINPSINTIDSGVETLQMDSTNNDMVLPTTVDIQQVVWSYINGTLTYSMIHYAYDGTGASSTGDHLFYLPTGYTFDTNYVAPYVGNIGAPITNSTLYGRHLPGYGLAAYGGGTAGRRAVPLVYDTRSFRLVTLEIFDGTGGVFERAVGAGNFSIGGTAMTYKTQFTVRAIKA